MSDNRSFHYAIAASLALHAAVLFGVPDLIDTARRAVSFPPPLIARLLEPEAPPVTVPEVASPKKEPEKKKPAQSPRVTSVPRLAEAPAPAPVEAPGPLPVPAAPAPQPEAVPAPRAEAPAAPASVSPPVAAVDPQPQAAPPTPDAREAVSRDQYRLLLVHEAVRYAKRRHPPKGYPPLAHQNNWEGIVRVAVAVSADGQVSINLRSSSGYEVLDRQALDNLRHAARAVSVPQALRGRNFAFEVPAVYRLDED